MTRTAIIRGYYLDPVFAFWFDIHKRTTPGDADIMQIYLHYAIRTRSYDKVRQSLVYNTYIFIKTLNSLRRGEDWVQNMSIIYGILIGSYDPDRTMKGED